MEDSTKIKVQNRELGSVGYTIPDLNNLHRTFQAGETKVITFEELFKLAQVPGGEYIINNYLIIHDQEAVKEILGMTEPEYFYTENDIKRLMLQGSVDEFEDCLNFAPKGVLELIKEVAVSLPLNDVAKRDLILKKLDFNVDKAIDLAKTDDVEVVEAPKRKAAKPQVGGTTQPQQTQPIRKVVKG